MVKVLLYACLMLFFAARCAIAGHLHKEKEYQDVWCKDASGVMEFRLQDGTRVDCLTDQYAVEFDFAPKWAEAIGQSLYYAEMTGKQPAVVMVLENDDDVRYLERLGLVADRFGITVWTMKPSDLY